MQNMKYNSKGKSMKYKGEERGKCLFLEALLISAFPISKVTLISPQYSKFLIVSNKKSLNETSLRRILREVFTEKNKKLCMK